MTFGFELVHDIDRKPVIVVWKKSFILLKFKARNQKIYTDLQTLRMWHTSENGDFLSIKHRYLKKILDKLSYFAVRYLWTCLMFQWN